MMGYIYNRLLKKIRGRAIKNSNIPKTSKIESGSTIINTNFGKYSFCGYDCKICNADIGAFCSIADGVVIGLAEHPIDWVSTSPVFYAGRDSVKKKFATKKRAPVKKCIIGNDVWIGERALIKPGVIVGDGAVIGMGSVVTKNVLPYEIVAGVPARHIKYRFDTNTAEKLLDSKWWKLSDSDLKKHAIYCDNPSKFVDSLEGIL